MPKKKNSTLDARIAEFSTPKGRAELWKRARRQAAAALDGGASLMSGLADSMIDNGLSAAGDAYKAVRNAQHKYKRLSQALRNRRIDAKRFEESWTQIRETLATDLKAVKERELREAAATIEGAVNDGLDMILKLARAVIG